MVPAGSTINADVVGGFSLSHQLMTTVADIDRFVPPLLGRFGTVVYVQSIAGNALHTQYSSSVRFTTAYSHASIDDVRGIIAGVFQEVTGERPQVLLEGEHRPAPAASEGSWLADVKWIVVGLAVLAVAVVVGPTVRRVSQ